MVLPLPHRRKEISFAVFVRFDNFSILHACHFFLSKNYFEFESSKTKKFELKTGTLELVVNLKF